MLLIFFVIFIGIRIYKQLTVNKQIYHRIPLKYLYSIWLKN